MSSEGQVGCFEILTRYIAKPFSIARRRCQPLVQVHSLGFRKLFGGEAVFRVLPPPLQGLETKETSPWGWGLLSLKVADSSPGRQGLSVLIYRRHKPEKSQQVLLEWKLRVGNRASGTVAILANDP